jgi:acetylxylan esterase
MLWRHLCGLSALAGLAASASLQQVTDFGNNPSKINMFVYVPDKLAEKPAVIVAVRE